MNFKCAPCGALHTDGIAETDTGSHSRESSGLATSQSEAVPNVREASGPHTALPRPTCTDPTRDSQVGTDCIWKHITVTLKLLILARLS